MRLTRGMCTYVIMRPALRESRRARETLSVYCASLMNSVKCHAPNSGAGIIYTGKLEFSSVWRKASPISQDDPRSKEWRRVQRGIIPRTLEIKSARRSRTSRDFLRYKVAPRDIFLSLTALVPRRRHA